MSQGSKELSREVGGEASHCYGNIAIYILKSPKMKIALFKLDAGNFLFN